MNYIFGIEYYRPPNPPRENWEEDLRQIAACGFNTIRCWLYWRTTERAAGRWDFSDYDQLFELAARNNLRVLVTLIAEAPPAWALRKHPDAILVRPDGTREPIQDNCGMVSVGGYPGFCLDEPQAKALAARFITAAAKRYGAHPALAGFALQNEVMPFYGMAQNQTPVNHPCQQPLFQEFLRRRYRTIARYNAIHQTTLSDFTGAQMRAAALPPDGLDRIQFCAERVIAQLQWRRDLVKSVAPNAPTFCHAAGGKTSVLNPPWIQEDIAGLVDGWGTSNYENDYWSHLLVATVTRSAAQGKPWGIVEMTGGSMWRHYPTSTRSPEELVSLPLTFIALGATTNLFWQYRPERVGSESPNFGLVLENGRLPKRSQAVARLAKALRQHRSLFTELRWPQPKIALVVDWHGFACEEGNGAASQSAARIEELAGINGALAMAGFEAGALSSAHWEKHGAPAGVKLLVMPGNVVLTDAMLDRLDVDLANGVSVLVGPMFGHYTGDGWLRTQAQFVRIEKIFGAARCDFTVEDSPRFTLATNKKIIVTGSQFWEEYELLGATPWLRNGQVICGTRYRANGSVRFRVGSFLGHKFFGGISTAVSGGVVNTQTNAATGNPLLPALLTSAAKAAGFAPEHPTQPPFVVRIGQHGRQGVAFIRNTTGKPQTFRFGSHLRAVSALDGAAILARNAATLRFAPQETRVFLLNATALKLYRV